MLLLVDVYTAHGIVNKLPNLSNLNVNFLLSSITSKIQPLNAEFTACIDNKFCQKLLFRVFDNIDCGLTRNYNIDTLTEMCWIIQKEERWFPLTIQNMFCHSFAAGDSMVQDYFANKIARSLESEMETDEQLYALAYSRVRMDTLLIHLVEEADVAKKPTIRDRCRKCFDVQDCGPEEEENNVNEGMGR